MKYPTKTPSAVRAAIDLYVRRRRVTFCWTVLLVWLAAAGTIVSAFMLIDRFWEVGLSFRSAGPWSVGISSGIAGLLILCAVVWRWKPFSVAVMLDQALPENLDRWATSLDLSRRLERGERVGATECVERLLADAESQTCPSSVIHKVSRRPLIWGGLCLCAVAAGFVGRRARIA